MSKITHFARMRMRNSHHEYHFFLPTHYFINVQLITKDFSRSEEIHYNPLFYYQGLVRADRVRWRNEMPRRLSGEASGTAA